MMVINASNFIVEDDGMVYARKYSWGTQNVEDPASTDFQLLYSIVTGHLCFFFRDHAEEQFWVYFRKCQKKNRVSRGRDTLTVGIACGIGIGIVMGALGLFLSKLKIVSNNTK